MNLFAELENRAHILLPSCLYPVINILNYEIF